MTGLCISLQGSNWLAAFPTSDLQKEGETETGREKIENGREISGQSGIRHKRQSMDLEWNSMM